MSVPYPQALPDAYGPPRYNTLAFVSFALALTFATSPVALALGIIALRQIARTGERGRVLALCGVVIANLFTLAMLGYVAFALWAVFQ